MSKQLLYQQALLAHHKSPYGFNDLIDITCQGQGSNLACGDEITLQLNIADGVIQELAFTGDSCAICRASASILCHTIANKTLASSERISKELIKLLLNKTLSKKQLASQNENSVNVPIVDTLDNELAAAFSPILSVCAFPVRVQCAVLPWNTLIEVTDKYLKKQD